MPYCKTTLVINQQTSAKEVLDQFARIKFQSTCAVQCEWNQAQFVVDNGMNNIRAVVDAEKGLIMLYCRYSQYIDIGDELLKQFADEQGFSTKSVEC